MTTEILQKERKKGWKWTPEMRARQCVVRQKIGRPAWSPDAPARFKLLMKNRVSPRKGAKLTDDTIGYDCRIIWASELKNIELVKTKVCSLLHV